MKYRPALRIVREYEECVAEREKLRAEVKALESTEQSILDGIAATGAQDEKVREDQHVQNERVLEVIHEFKAATDEARRVFDETVRRAAAVAEEKSAPIKAEMTKLSETRLGLGRQLAAQHNQLVEHRGNMRVLPARIEKAEAAVAKKEASRELELAKAKVAEIAAKEEESKKQAALREEFMRRADPTGKTAAVPQVVEPKRPSYFLPHPSAITAREGRLKRPAKRATSAFNSSKK